MSLAIRIIPCLDVDAGRVVKGINFINLVDAGDPVEMARKYQMEGADELTFLDISASADGRSTTIEVVKKCAEEIFILLTVGGGISSVAQVDALLRAGADKVSINTAAISKPELINEISERFGNQVLVLSVDARRNENGEFEVTTHGGRKSSGLDMRSWIEEIEIRGAGEILSDVSSVLSPFRCLLCTVSFLLSLLCCLLPVVSALLSPFCCLCSSC